MPNKANKVRVGYLSFLESLLWLYKRRGEMFSHARIAAALYAGMACWFALTATAIALEESTGIAIIGLISTRAANLAFGALLCVVNWILLGRLRDRFEALSHKDDEIFYTWVVYTVIVILALAVAIGSTVG